MAESSKSKKVALDEPTELDAEQKLGVLETMDPDVRKKSLLGSMSEPALGRRESPEPYDPWPRRKLYIRGLLLGALVIAALVLFIILMAPNYAITQ